MQTKSNPYYYFIQLRIISIWSIIKNPINTFVLITAGDSDESGFSAMESTKILKKKGINVTHSDVIQIPIN